MTLWIIIIPPARIRGYQFNALMQSKGLRSEILSLAEHISLKAAKPPKLKNLSDPHKSYQVLLALHLSLIQNALYTCSRLPFTPSVF